MRLRWCRCLRLPVLLHANNQRLIIETNLPTVIAEIIVPKPTPCKE